MPAPRTDRAAPPRAAAARSRLAALAALAATLCAPAWAFDLAAVMALTAQRRDGEARFTEQRTVSGLDQTLQSSGVLRFRAPDRFERRTELPRPESMLVDGDTLVLERGGRQRRLPLDAVPEIGALVGALRGTLNGDATALQRPFEVTVDGSAERWTLTLTPRAAPLSGSVREMRLVGQRSDLRSVELTLPDGDRSLMQIAPTRPLPPGALAGPAAAASGSPGSSGSSGGGAPAGASAASAAGRRAP
jgi:outer membrane lipoprotein-sorting protein